jgi:Asp-tRNA(Asn)/Glu-tRNA(Gln) amidotransferase A subunit family amidase
MTLAEIKRMIQAAIRAARQEGATVVEVKIGDEAMVRIPLVPEKALAVEEDIVL